MVLQALWVHDHLILAMGPFTVTTLWDDNLHFADEEAKEAGSWITSQGMDLKTLLFEMHHRD